MRGPHAPSEAGSETAQHGRRVASASPSDDAGFTPASAGPGRTRPDRDLAAREIGVLSLILALLALRLALDQVTTGPPHDPTAAELVLGVLAFTPAAFGAAALWFGEELFR